MSKAFEPAAIVGGSVLIEKEPFDSTYGLRSHRGIEIVTHRDDGGTSPAFRHVLAYGCLGWSHDIDPSGFESVASAMASRAEEGAPRILKAFGHRGRAHLVTLEPLAGIRLDLVVAALKERGQPLSAAVALTIISELLAFLRTLDVRHDIFVGLHDLLLTPEGRIRARPTPTAGYRECYSSVTYNPVIEAGPAHMVVSYMAPYLDMDPTRPVEQSERWNIYVVGLMLYELLLVGPWPTPDTLFGAIRMVVHEGLSPLRAHRPELPEPVLTFVEQAMASPGSDRPASWDELRAGLSALRSEAEPVHRVDLIELYESLPSELGITFEPPSSDALEGWRELPHLGYERVEVPRDTGGSGPGQTAAGSDAVSSQ